MSSRDRVSAARRLARGCENWRAGRPTISATVCRGLSESYGFWKTIWTRRRASRGRRPARDASGEPSRLIVPPSGSCRPDDAAGDRGLAAAGFAHQCDALARPDRRTRCPRRRPRIGGVPRASPSARRPRATGCGAGAGDLHRRAWTWPRRLLPLEAAGEVAGRGPTSSGISSSQRAIRCTQRGANAQPAVARPRRRRRPECRAACAARVDRALPRPGHSVYGCSAHASPPGGALLDDPPAIHHRDPVGDRSDDREVVRDVQDREPGLVGKPADLSQQPLLNDDVETGRGLVEDDDAGRQTSAIAIATRCCCPPES